MDDIATISNSDKKFKYINNKNSISLDSLLTDYYKSLDDKANWKDLIYIDKDN
jgi:hypothetical protein